MTVANRRFQIEVLSGAIEILAEATPGPDAFSIAEHQIALDEAREAIAALKQELESTTMASLARDVA